MVVALAVSACTGSTATPTAPPATATPTAISVTASPSVAPSPTPTAEASPSIEESAGPTSAPEVFKSARYPYSITLTADWTVKANPGTWSGALLTDTQPGTDFYIDTTPPPVDWVIQVGFLPVASGTTLSAWAAAEGPRAVEVQFCSAQAPEPATTIGSYQVIIQRVNCRGDEFVLNAFLLHGGDGILLEWTSPSGNETADRAKFLAILATLKLG